MATVKMSKLVPPANGVTIYADVHPDEVKNYEKGGWIICEKVKQDDGKRKR